MYSSIIPVICHNYLENCRSCYDDNDYIPIPEPLKEDDVDYPVTVDCRKSSFFAVCSLVSFVLQIFVIFSSYYYIYKVILGSIFFLSVAVFFTLSDYYGKKYDDFKKSFFEKKFAERTNLINLILDNQRRKFEKRSIKK